MHNARDEAQKSLKQIITGRSNTHNPLTVKVSENNATYIYLPLRTSQQISDIKIDRQL